jgi:hypothetical protein
LHQSLRNIDKIKYEHHLDFSTSHHIGSNYFNQEPRQRPSRQANCGASREGLINTTVTHKISKTRARGKNGDRLAPASSKEGKNSRKERIVN